MLSLLHTNYEKQFDQALDRNSAKTKDDLPPPDLTLLSPCLVDPGIAASLARYGTPWRGATRKIRKTGDVHQEKQISRGKDTLNRKSNLKLEKQNKIPILILDGPTRNWENQPIRGQQQQNIWFS